MKLTYLLCMFSKSATQCVSKEIEKTWRRMVVDAYAILVKGNSIMTPIVKGEGSVNVWHFMFWVYVRVWQKKVRGLKYPENVGRNVWMSLLTRRQRGLNTKKIKPLVKAQKQMFFRWNCQVNFIFNCMKFYSDHYSSF